MRFVQVLAVRHFKDTPIPEPIVRQIVDAGRLTASASNRQPWHFIVVRDKETLHRLGQLASTGPYIAQAPLAIVVAMDSSPLAISDGSRAIQDMILAAWSQGVGSNWVGFNNLPEVNRPLGIPEEVWSSRSFRSATRLRPSGRARRNANLWARLSIMNDGANHSNKRCLNRPDLRGLEQRNIKKARDHACRTRLGLSND